MKKNRKNEKTVALSPEALDVYMEWPHMERSKLTSEAIVKHDKNVEQIESLKKRVEKLEGQ